MPSTDQHKLDRIEPIAAHVLLQVSLLMLPALALMAAFGSPQDWLIATCCFLLGAMAARSTTAHRHKDEGAQEQAWQTECVQPNSPEMSGSHPLQRDAAAMLDAQLLGHETVAVPELAAYGRSDQWRLVCDIDQGRARVLRKLDAGDFTLRITSGLACSVDELLSLVIELDLMPTWNNFCSAAAIFHRYSRVDYLAGGGTVMPWPVPRYNIVLRARLLDLMSTLGCMLVVATHTQACGDDKLPAQMRGRRNLPLQAICALTPSTDSFGSANLYFDLVVAVPLSAAAYVPGWVLDFIMRRVVPSLCRRVLSLVDEIASRPASEFRRRMARDEFGVYDHIHTAVGKQQASHSGICT
jgi:hypothetical protein